MRVRTPRSFGKRARGVTLVELVVSIVIVSIAAAAVLGVLSIATTGSADAMVRYQAVAIANAYLEEILLKPVADPDGVNTGETRATFDDINDYAGLEDDGAVDQFGNAIGTLAQYDVTVAVAPTTLGNAPGVAALLVTVTVRDPAGHSTVLGGYRALAT